MAGSELADQKRRPRCQQVMLGPMGAVALLTLLVLLAVTALGCGHANEDPPSYAESVRAEPTEVGVDLDAASSLKGSLLVMRKEAGAWMLWRFTLDGAAEQRLTSLGFRPIEVVSSPDDSKVLYIGGGARMALVDVQSAEASRVSLDGLPIRSIDGASWISQGTIVFGGCRTSYPAPEDSLLYLLDARTGLITPLRGLAGSEPSWASNTHTLSYVTRRDLAGPWLREAIRLVDLSGDGRPKVLRSERIYIDAGRAYNSPRISPDGRYLLSGRTGTDVSVTYELMTLDLPWPPYLTVAGVGNLYAAWNGERVAWLECEDPASGGQLAVHIYDTTSGSMSRERIPEGHLFGQIDWSSDGGLVGGASWFPEEDVYVLREDGDWMRVTTGTLPVWVD